jgi:hypothetical protein
LRLSARVAEEQERAQRRRRRWGDQHRAKGWNTGHKRCNQDRANSDPAIAIGAAHAQAIGASDKACMPPSASAPSSGNKSLPSETARCEHSPCRIRLIATIARMQSHTRPSTAPSGTTPHRCQRTQTFAGLAIAVVVKWRRRKKKKQKKKSAPARSQLFLRSINANSCSVLSFFFSFFPFFLFLFLFFFLVLGGKNIIIHSIKKSIGEAERRAASHLLDLMHKEAAVAARHLDVGNVHHVAVNVKVNIRRRLAITGQRVPLAPHQLVGQVLHQEGKKRRKFSLED